MFDLCPYRHKIWRTLQYAKMLYKRVYPNFYTNTALQNSKIYTGGKVDAASTRSAGVGDPGCLESHKYTLWRCLLWCNFHTFHETRYQNLNNTTEVTKWIRGATLIQGVEACRNYTNRTCGLCIQGMLLQQETLIIPAGNFKNWHLRSISMFNYAICSIMANTCNTTCLEHTWECIDPHILGAYSSTQRWISVPPKIEEIQFKRRGSKGAPVVAKTTCKCGASRFEIIFFSLCLEKKGCVCIAL